MKKHMKKHTNNQTDTQTNEQTNKHKVFYQFTCCVFCSLNTFQRKTCFYDRSIYKQFKMIQSINAFIYVLSKSLN